MQLIIYHCMIESSLEVMFQTKLRKHFNTYKVIHNHCRKGVALSDISSVFIDVLKSTRAACKEKYNENL